MLQYKQKLRWDALKDNWNFVNNNYHLNAAQFCYGLAPLIYPLQVGTFAIFVSELVLSHQDHSLYPAPCPSTVQFHLFHFFPSHYFIQTPGIYSSRQPYCNPNRQHITSSIWFIYTVYLHTQPNTFLISCSVFDFLDFGVHHFHVLRRSILKNLSF